MLLHLLVDAKGQPVGITSTAANGDERKQIIPLVREFKRIAANHLKCCSSMLILEADKGYDSADLRTALLAEQILPLIPWRKIGKADNPDRPSLDKVCDYFKIKPIRWKVERAFSWIKRKSRRLMLRWERLSSPWNAFCRLGIILYWLPILVG